MTSQSQYAIQSKLLTGLSKGKRHAVGKCVAFFENHDHKMTLLAVEKRNASFKLAQSKPVGVELQRDDALMIL